MDKCRICLELKKNMCSIFEKDYGISYAYMMSSVAKVKIVEGAYNSICLQCRRKLRSLFNFKKDIERSDIELNQHLKIFRFDNINDVSAQLLSTREIVTEDKNNIIHTDVSRVISLLSDSNLYGDTTITKIVSHQTFAGKDETRTVLHNETQNYKTEDNYVYHYDEVDTYELNFLRRKQFEKKRRTKKNKGSTKNQKCVTNLKKICIKPIILENLRIIPSRRKPNKIQKKLKRRKRMDICPYCGIMSSNMKSHLMVHIGEKKFKCSECSKAFFTSNQLSYHQSSHFMTGAFKCDHCVAVFNNKTSLQSHMVSHTDDKNHVCPICNKGFKRKNSLRRHKLIHSSSAKSVKCELCNMSFLYKQGLRHHMRVHTGERPFKCEICSQPYSYKHDFNRHCLKKHGVFLKQRSVYVMNEEVLMQERELMKDLMLRIQGVVKEGEPLNPFQGPHAALAFDQAVKALGSCQIPIGVML